MAGIVKNVSKTKQLHTANYRKGNIMNYEIKISASGEITRHEWSTEGYKLIMIARPDDEAMFSIDSPADSAEIMVDNFDEERKLSVSWASLGDVSPAEAALFAASINTAVRVAGEFQKIVDSFK